MDRRRILFLITLMFSVLLEVWVRWVMPFTHGQDGFGVWAPVDNVMHLFWGLNIFLFLVLFLRLKPWEALLGVYAWQMCWEAGEMIGDRFLGQPGYMLDHFFLDGIKDTIVDLAGGALGWMLLSKTKEKFRGARAHAWLARLLLTHLWLMLPLLPIGIFLLIRSGESADTLAIGWIVGAGIVALLLTAGSKGRFSRRVS